MKGCGWRYITATKEGQRFHIGPGLSYLLSTSFNICTAACLVGGLAGVLVTLGCEYRFRRHSIDIMNYRLAGGRVFVWRVHSF